MVIGGWGGAFSRGGLIQFFNSDRVLFEGGGSLEGGTLFEDLQYT